MPSYYGTRKRERRVSAGLPYRSWFFEQSLWQLKYIEKRKIGNLKEASWALYKLHLVGTIHDESSKSYIHALDPEHGTFSTARHKATREHSAQSTLSCLPPLPQDRLDWTWIEGWEGFWFNPYRQQARRQTRVACYRRKKNVHSVATLSLPLALLYRHDSSSSSSSIRVHLSSDPVCARMSKLRLIYRVRTGTFTIIRTVASLTREPFHKKHRDYHSSRNTTAVSITV